MHAAVAIRRVKATKLYPYDAPRILHLLKVKKASIRTHNMEASMFALLISHKIL